MKTANLTTRVCSIIAIVLVAAACTATVSAAPFTAGNLVILTAPPAPAGQNGSGPVGTCSTGASAQQITLREYTTAGVLVQTIPLPTSGASYGLANGSETAAPQLHFSDTNNQRVYIAVSYVDNNPGVNCLASTRNPGYILYDANTNSIIEAISNVANPSVDFHGRGVDTLNGCTVFSSTSGNNNGTYRTINGISQQFIAGNGRYLQIMDPYPGYPAAFPGMASPPLGSALAFITSAGTSQGFAGGGLYVFDPVGPGCPAPCSTPEVKLFPSTGSNPLGFWVADQNTVYLTEVYNPFTPSGASTGIYKFSYQAPCAGGSPVWTNIGRLDALATEVPSAQAMDVAAIVSGGNATLYVVGGGQAVGCSKVYKIGPDPLVNACPTSSWKTTAATTLVTGLIGARSIGIVPNTIVPPNRNLTTTVAPAATGTVTRNPNAASYPQCTFVDLTANPNAGQTFVQWSNGAVGSDNPVQISMDGDKTVTANFTDTATHFILTVNIVGRGTIKVGDGTHPPNLSYTYPVIDKQNIAYPNPGPTNGVPLAATPIAFTGSEPSQNGYVFDHWTGDASGTNPNTTINIDANKTVTAVFLPIYRIRPFATGNGKWVVTSPPNDGQDHDNLGNGTYPYFRQGTQVTLTATASGNTNATAVFCPNVPPVQPWTFVEWQDVNAAHLSSLSSFVTAPIVAPTDFTARFDETPANAARALTPGNLLVAQVRDFSSVANPGEIDLREYTPGGQLVQPVIQIPSLGTPSGQANSPTSGVGLQIDIDSTVGNRPYASVNLISGGTNTGFIRSAFNGTAWTQDLATGTFSFNAEGRGVAIFGAHVYYAFDGGVHDYNTSTGTDSLLTSDCTFSDNCRMLRVFNNQLYVGTAGTTGDFTTDGPGIYRIDFPGGSPANPTSCSPPNSGTNVTFTQILSTGGAGVLDFAFANANTLYVGFNSAGTPTYKNIHKFTCPGGNCCSTCWTDASFGTPEGIAAMNNQWVSGIDLTVAGNNDDVAIYFMATGDPQAPCETPATIGAGPVNAYVYRIDDKLISAPPDWYTLDPSLAYNAGSNRIAVVVPMVTRGRGLKIVRTAYCASMLGDTNGDYKLNGKDIQSFIACYIAAGVSGVPTAGCGCADVQLSHVLNQANVNAFVTLLLSQ